jgi:hypothetical protein
VRVRRKVVGEILSVGMKLNGGRRCSLNVFLAENKIWLNA